ncbi:MAG TPA: phosphopantetheine-binding protein [Spirochaetota bacterium]|nr:phosphopantetheine-binding protein [Spirochaetota bacterium]
MTNDDIKKIVTKIFVDEFEKEENEITEEASLFDDLELDSLDGIDLIVALEKAVKAKVGKDVKIEEEKAKSLKTVGDIYKVIEELAS